MKRFVSTILALAFVLATGPAAPRADGATQALPFAPPVAAEVLGSGPDFACIGCGAAGLAIALGGPLLWIKASLVPGSTLAVAGCVAACGVAFGFVE